MKNFNLILFYFSSPVEDIKNKFKNLRTTFQRQYKMVKASKVCGSEDVFVPQWKHYQQLMFLQGCWDQEDSLDYLPLSPLAVLHEEKQSTLPSPGPNISFLPNPSTSSTNMMVKCCWTEESERALIAFYSGKNKPLNDLWQGHVKTICILPMLVFHSWWELFCVAQSIAVCGTRGLRATTTVSSDRGCLRLWGSNCLITPCLSQVKITWCSPAYQHSWRQCPIPLEVKRTVPQVLDMGMRPVGYKADFYSFVKKLLCNTTNSNFILLNSAEPVIHYQ